MLAIPQIDGIDAVFGNIKHMPKYESLPEEFKDRYNNRHCEFVSKWFFSGVDKEGMKRIVAKEGVERGKALAAIGAVLASFEPKHEHKIGACGFMLSEWFILDGKE